MATTKKPTDEAAAEPRPVELESDTPAASVKPAAPADLPPGGVFLNTGAVDLVLLQPPAVVKPGRVIELEFDIRHRDLRLATAAEIKAARDAEAAEQASAEAAAAAEPSTAPGQE
jgi:hypothetical protein